MIESVGKEAVDNAALENKELKEQLTIFDIAAVGKSLQSNEAKYEKNNNNLTNFSYTQLDTYKTCPLRYKYQYVLKIPTPPSSAASFGASIHAALQQFYLEFKEGRADDDILSKDLHSVSREKEPDLKRLLTIYQQTWIPVGYKSKIHDERMKIEGKNFLQNFFEKFHRSDLKILDLEKFFKIKINDQLFITGKIDRVDLKKDQKLEIIDYKTGTMPDKKKLTQDLQLSIYAIAASSEGLYRKDVEKIILTFYFLKENKKNSLTRTTENLETVKKTLVTLTDDIKTSAFEPKVGPWCSFCPFKINCEAWQ